MNKNLRDDGGRLADKHSEGILAVRRLIDRMLMSREILDRRAALRSHFDVARQFKELEESCIPSYLHKNSLAAWVSWMRLVEAARLYKRWASAGAILDFGSATGEIAHLIAPLGQYCFIEQEDIVAQALQKCLPNARRIDLEHAGDKQFAAIFALDSLEHNHDVEPIVSRLEAGLGDSGVLILSGPTENLLYRVGRRLAGFSGHYHHQTIWDIEKRISARMSLLERKLIPVGLPLFSVSAWRVKR
jgi:2-polyprenyl-3-methyl-5-hydroxy-6-metoxy-1,4-benzoquinol methylase